MEEHPDSQKKHLRRLSRVYSKAPIFFITANTKNRQKILASQEMMAICEEVWKNSRDLYAWSVGPFVIMPDHVHFLCRAIPVGEDLEEEKPLHLFVGKWKEWVAKHAARRGYISDELWQPEFFDHVIRSDESLRKKADYIWDNPVRAGLVAEPQEWVFLGNHDGWGLEE